MLYTNQRISGMVCWQKNYRERDLLVQILTDRFGFKTFLVRGAKKRGFKWQAGVLPFTLATYTATINDDGLSYFNSVDDAIYLQTVATDIATNAYATYLLGLVHAAYGTQPLGTFFLQAKTALQLMEHGVNPAILTNVIEVQLLKPFGVQPNWRDCVVCHRTSSPLDFSQAQGGLLCASHFHLDPYRYHLDAKTLYFLRLFSVLQLKPTTTVNVKDVTQQRLRACLDRLYDEEIGVHLKAKDFIDELGSWDKYLEQQQKKLDKRN